MQLSITLFGVTMKKFLRTLVLVVCVCAALLCGCGKQGLKDNPDTNATIVGNGGYAVQKGDYLYYVNGYLSDYKTKLSDYRKHNVFGKVTYGAVYRTKLVNNGVEKDDKGFLTKTECVVPKVVGFENGGFYIVGDYIYYGTPYMQKNADGVLQNDRVSFNRIKIDGTDNKEVYVSGEDVSSIEWKVYNYDGKAYLVVQEDTKITSIEFNGKKTKTIKVASDFTAGKLNEDLNPTNEYVYYTRAVKDDEKGFSTSGNLLCKASFVTGEETAYQMDNSSTFEIKAYVNNQVYYTRKLSNKTTYLFALNANINLKNQNSIQLSDADYSNYYFIDDVKYTVVGLDSNKNLVKLYNVNGEIKHENIASGISTVVGISDNKVYYIADSLLKSVDMDTLEDKTVSGVGEATDKTFMLSDAKGVDLDGRYVYVFASYKSATSETNSDGETTNITSNYLNRIDTFASDMVAEFVGKMDDDRLPEKPTKNEETGVTPKWVY